MKKCTLDFVKGHITGVALADEYLAVAKWWGIKLFSLKDNFPDKILLNQQGVKSLLISPDGKVIYLVTYLGKILMILVMLLI
ncbi:hypothetical protein H5U35_00750 [Candidatus Aerophobetes bacterium]|nr:hypothetical protein [Candidatus Aerophobetes bacterium]